MCWRTVHPCGQVEQDNKSRSLPKSGHVQTLQAEELAAIRRRVVSEIMEVHKEFELLKMGFKLLSERIPCDDVEINERAMQLARFEVDGMGDLARSGKSMAEFFDIISTRFKEHKERIAKLTDQEPSLGRFCEVCSVLKDMILASVAENDLAFFYSDTWGQGWKILKVPPKKQNPVQGIQSFYYDRAEQDRLVDALDEVFEALEIGGDTIGYPVDIEKIFLKPGWFRRLGSLTGKKRIWKIIFNGTEDKAIFTEMHLSSMSMIFDMIPSTMAGMREKAPQAMWWIKVSDYFNYEFRYDIYRVLLCGTSYKALLADPMQAMHEIHRICMIARLLGHRDQSRHKLELLNADRIEAEAVLVNRDRHCDEEIVRAEMKKEEIRGKWREIISFLREAETDFYFIFESDRKGPPVIDVELRSLLDANREYMGACPKHRPLFAPKATEAAGDAIAAIGPKGVETEKEGALATQENGQVTGTNTRDGGCQEGQPKIFEGMVIGRRYRILKLLGHGAMGSVYEVEDVTLGGPHLAMKLFSPIKKDAVDRLRARFDHEARVLYKISQELTHESVCLPRVLTYEPNPVGLPPYYVMDMVVGPRGNVCTLADVRDKEQDIFTLEQIEIWFEDVCKALYTLHQHDCLHRDIKPENILLNAHGHAVISDFGTAKILTEDGVASESELLTRVGRFEREQVGTRRYWSPELREGAEATVASDIYALAATFWKVIFDADNKASNYPPSHEDFEDLEDEFGEKWHRVLVKMLAPNPSDRPASAEECWRLYNGDIGKGLTAEQALSLIQ